ncbi:MAG: TetR/AcrR family transcriptional regulator [Deltaproteobacteria bacterium]|nr:TetR/AcrR family transcriptional regulator [Deltaproteobacteria bacterium]
MNTKDTKKILIACATRVFFENGFENASMRQIVEMAEVTKPTLYYYFKNKAELYRYILDTHLQKVSNKVNQIISDYNDYHDALKKIIECFSDTFKNESQEYTITQREINGRGVFYAEIRDHYFVNLFKNLASFLRVGIEKNIIRPTLDPVHSAYSMVATIMFYYNHGVLINDVLTINNSPKWTKEDLIKHIYSLYTINEKTT